MLQKSLASDCILEGEPEFDTVAGLDLAVYPDSRIGIAAAVLYSVNRNRAIGQVVMIGDLSFPHKPGLLAFREAPLLLDTVMELREEPDLLLVDGHGYAHPRRFGLASHLGLLLEIPTVGIAESVLVGEYEQPGSTIGSHTDLWDGEPIGYAYRSMEKANPIFLSAGHRVGLRAIPNLLEPLLNRNTRLPTPLHRTKRLAGEHRRRIERVRSVFPEGSSVCLVGGGLRDYLLGKVPHDYDLLVTNFQSSIKNKLEDCYSGNLFALDEERSIYRLTSDEFTIDVTVVEEGRIIDDLRRRDFTVNSIALDLERESWIDPEQGREDAEERILRPTSEDSLSTDPLRILRAYRLAQYHNLSFSHRLRHRINQSAEQLTEVSRERVIEELLKMASGPDPTSSFEHMRVDELFDRVSFLRERGIEDMEIVTPWREHVLDLDTVLNDQVHGDYDLLRGFQVGRLLSRPEVYRWPFHRSIKTLVETSYDGLDEEIEFQVLKSSKLHLTGRFLGWAIWDHWSGKKLAEGLAEMEEFIERREVLERTIVKSLDTSEEISKRKDERLQKELPELWLDVVTSSPDYQSVPS